jgi:shikimate kinase
VALITTPNMAQPIFLIGYMGCGKSTLARALAKYTGLQFIDLDNYIERRFMANVRDIFARYGEERFRDMEHRMLLEVADFENVIIACGGGTPCFHNNMEIINTHGTSIWLQASDSILHHRLVRGRHKRPLLAEKTDDEIMQIIRTGLQQRLPFYSRAHHTFCTDTLETVEEIRATTRQFIQQFLPQ